jgi:hypothetical protein
MSGLGKKRKSAAGPKSSSPAKKSNLSPKTPRATSSSPWKKRSTRRRNKVTEEHTPQPHPASSSPPKTPKSPSGATRLGLDKGTAKSLLKHGSKITPLYNMLYGFAQMIMEKQSKNEEEFKPLLCQLAGQLVNLLSSEVFFSCFPFSPFQSLTLRILNYSSERHFPLPISKSEYDAMCEELNLISAGTIEFAEADVLLGDVSILDSFKQQVDLVRHVNVSAVRILC